MTDFKEISEALDMSGQWQITDYIVAATLAKRDVPLMLALLDEKDAKIAELESALIAEDELTMALQSRLAILADDFADQSSELFSLNQALEKP